MTIELLKMIPVSETFVLGFIAIIGATKSFKAAADYALTKEENAITIDNVNFTKFIRITTSSSFIIISALWGLL